MRGVLKCAFGDIGIEAYSMWELKEMIAISMVYLGSEMITGIFLCVLLSIE